MPDQLDLPSLMPRASQAPAGSAAPSGLAAVLACYRSFWEYTAEQEEVDGLGSWAAVGMDLDIVQDGQAPGVLAENPHLKI